MALSGSPTDTYAREFNQTYGGGGRGIITHAIIQQVASDKRMFEGRWIRPLEDIGSAMYEIVRNQYIDSRLQDLSPDEAIHIATNATVRIPTFVREALDDCGISLQSVFRGCVQGMKELKQLQYGGLEEDLKENWAPDKEKTGYLLPDGKKITA